MYLRAATLQDLDAILAIEAQSFPSPWSRQNFLGELSHPHAHLLVAGPDPPAPGEVWGYILFWLVIDEMHLLNLAVHPARRRQGLGRRLLTHALAVARRHQAVTAWLEVRPSNQPALQLYRSLGFVQVASRPRYYSDTGEDALILALHFAAAPPDLLPADD